MAVCLCGFIAVLSQTTLAHWAAARPGVEHFATRGSNDRCKGDFFLSRSMNVFRALIVGDGLRM